MSAGCIASPKHYTSSTAFSSSRSHCGSSIKPFWNGVLAFFLAFSGFLLHNNCRLVAVSIIISLSLFNRYSIVICSIDISLQMIVCFLSCVDSFQFLYRGNTSVLHWKENLTLCSVCCLSCLQISSAKLLQGLLLFYNFNIFYCSLYTLSLFTTNLDIKFDSEEQHFVRNSQLQGKVTYQ